MTIVEKTDKTIAIPVGIGVVQTETTRNFYNTNDSTITSSDVVVDKVAYGKQGKVVGSLDLYAEKQDSYENGYNEGNTDGYNSGFSAGNQVGYENGYSEGKDYGYDQGYYTGYENGYEYGENEGYSDGYAEGLDDGIEDGVEQQKSKLEIITITENGTYNKEDGYSSVVVEVPDLNGSYDEGYENGYNEGNQVGYERGYDDGETNGITIGRNEIIEGQSDATITPNNVLKGYVGYGKDNERIVGESEAITSIDVTASGIKFGYSTFKEIPSYYNFDNCSDMSNMFYNCTSLTSVPNFNTSNVTNMSSMFYYCSKLTTVPLFNTSKVNNMYYMFHSCSSLTSVPLFDTSKVTNMGYMFNSCKKLTSVPQFDTSSCETFQSMFAYCDVLEDVPELDWSGYKGSYGGSEVFGISYSYAKNLKNIGGFKNAGKSYTKATNYNSYKDIIICYCPMLTYESCMNVINKVYDMALNTENTYTPKIRLHATPYALLSADDIAIATNKGWIIQAG